MANPSDGTDPTDVASFRAELGDFVGRYQRLSMKEILLGPLLLEITQMSARHHLRAPASLALVGKAFAQMQLTVAELDPTLDPFTVATRFALRSTAQQFVGTLEPKALFYEAQKLQSRVLRLFEAVESLTGARPGSKLQVDLRGADDLLRAFGRGVRWMSVVMIATGTLVATAVAAVPSRIPWSVPLGIAAAGSLVVLLLLLSLLPKR